MIWGTGRAGIGSRGTAGGAPGSIGWYSTGGGSGAAGCLRIGRATGVATTGARRGTTIEKKGVRTATCGPTSTRAKGVWAIWLVRHDGQTADQALAQAKPLDLRAGQGLRDPMAEGCRRRGD